VGISIPPVSNPTLGIPQAAAALRNLERRQEIVANNLANVSTTGFKGEHPFARLLDSAGTAVVDAQTDRSQGALQRTDAPLDLALASSGFFVVSTPDGEQLTRGGSFRRDVSGVLVDAIGAPVLGEYDARGGKPGPVEIPEHAQSIRIEPDGAVVVDGAQVARLRVEDVAADTRLEHVGNGRFLAPATRTSLVADRRAVQQGALEDSNVTPVTSLVSMIEIQRAYSSAQRALTTIDGARGIVVTDLARAT
jgi:flagellar basal-body rod protein FlgF